MNLEEFDKLISKKRFWDHIIPNGIMGYYAGYVLLRPWKIFEEIGLRIKWAWQRVFNGYDSRASWSVDYWLCSMLPPILERLKGDKIGVPFEMFDGLSYENENNYTHSEESFKIAKDRWNAILDKMIIGFKEYADQKDDGFSRIPDSTNESLDLLKKYFGSLWD